MPTDVPPNLRTFIKQWNFITPRLGPFGGADYENHAKIVKIIHKSAFEALKMEKISLLFVE